jgi:hypothetical protein
LIEAHNPLLILPLASYKPLFATQPQIYRTGSLRSAKMRASQETDRTHVPSEVPSRIPSPNHLDALEEKETRMTNQDLHMSELEASRLSHQQLDSLDDQFGNVTEGETTNSTNDKDLSDKDLERGDVEGEKTRPGTGT